MKSFSIRKLTNPNQTKGQQAVADMVADNAMKQNGMGKNINGQHKK